MGLIEKQSKKDFKKYIMQLILMFSWDILQERTYRKAKLDGVKCRL